MFQSDDFDVFLDEELVVLESKCNESIETVKSNISPLNTQNLISNDVFKTKDNNVEQNNISIYSPKRKKRKFPGPAGLLPEPSLENLNENKNIIVSSQICSSQNQHCTSVFNDGPWCVMKNEFSSNVLLSQHTIAFTNAKALSQKLIGRRAPILAGLIQSIDRNLQYPSIVIKDPTGEIQGTLHRDVWDMFSSYLVPQYSVIVLKNIPVLTTGSVLKKNYLNITLKNVVAVYCDSENIYVSDKNKQTPLCSDSFHIENVNYQDSNVAIVRNLCKDSNENSPSKNESNFENKAIKRKSDENIELLLQDIDCDSLFDDFN